MKYWKSALACAAITMASFSAARAEEIKIGAIYMDAQGYYAGVRKGIQDAAKEAGMDLKLVETNAQGDVSKEGSFIDSLISSNVKVIIDSPVSADGSLRAIQRANDAKIPVICYNTCLSDADQKNLISAYTVGDPFDFGNKLGKVAADYFVSKGIKAPKIAVLNCEFVEVCITRRKGFEAALKEKVPDYKIVANQEGAVLDKAVSVAANILTANTELDAIFGEAGGATLGAARAIRAQNRVGSVVVFGGDMTAEIAQELVQNDVMKAVVDISGQGMGKLAFAQALKVLKGDASKGVKVAYDIDLYATPDDAKGWLKAHADGIP